MIIKKKILLLTINLVVMLEGLARRFDLDERKALDGR